MKIKPCKLQKKKIDYKPYVLLFVSLPKPKIPLRLFTNVHPLPESPEFTVVLGPV
jgi:hypothetical protein